MTWSSWAAHNARDAQDGKGALSAVHTHEEQEQEKLLVGTFMCPSVRALGRQGHWKPFQHWLHNTRHLHHVPVDGIRWHHASIM
jgi:hypothetical protein